MKMSVYEPMVKEESEELTQPTQIESLCMACGENGITRLLLTHIPHYREVILMSFTCPHCGMQNNEIQSGSAVQKEGVNYVLKVVKKSDLSRQVVKSDVASIVIPQIQLEIPANSQKGGVTTVEGVLSRTIEALSQDQPVRRALDEAAAQQIDDYIQNIQALIDLDEPFEFSLDDPSGNSFIENPVAPKVDEQLKVRYYARSKDQDHTLGIYSPEEINEGVEDESKGGDEQTENHEDESEAVDKDEVLSFPTNCPECNAPADTKMKVTEIPHFKEVVLMATTCDVCGHKTTEVKSGGGIEATAKRITLNVLDKDDLNRDLLKSETCKLIIPELELELGGHALGGRFTTVEGLLVSMQEQIESNAFLFGANIDSDSNEPKTKERLEKFKEALNQCIRGDIKFTLTLDDPAGNSYLQNLYAPDDDPEMVVERYERSWDQNEELGLNDIKTENYTLSNVIYYIFMRYKAF